MAANYKDLEEYGIIGNLETCALIARDGSIDWLCFPYLDSASVFAALLDAERGGFFRIKPTTKFGSVQTYLEETNILQTTFATSHGASVITDFMPVKEDIGTNTHMSLYRRVHCTEKHAQLSIQFQPRPDYARAEIDLRVTQTGALVTWQNNSLVLESPIALTVRDGQATGTLDLEENETAWFVLRYNHDRLHQPDEYEKILRKTKDYWLGWVHDGTHAPSVFDERWHDRAIRSGLLLKLLTHPENGSIAAAATTSLPETIGGVRNWDYRYAWIRDSSFTVQALFHLGHSQEVKAFLSWIKQLIRDADGPANLRTLYALHDQDDLKEYELKHLSGYRDSHPVRIGNDAAVQHQHDIYGEMVNAIYETTRYDDDWSPDLWPLVSEIVDYVCTIWQTKDSGIWEVRGEPRHYVYSKLMCWVALDRGIKIAQKRNLDAPLNQWGQTLQAIRQTILERGYSRDLKSFVQSFDSDVLDATSLLIAHLGFLPADDPRFQGTLDATMSRLLTDNGLVYRYASEDNLPGQEGTFMLCSFWLVKALAISNRIGEAESVFEDLLGYIGPLGLMSEEIDLHTGKQLGNLPQAFSHIGLVNSALYLDLALGREHEGPTPMGLAQDTD